MSLGTRLKLENVEKVNLAKFDTFTHFLAPFSAVKLQLVGGSLLTRDIKHKKMSANLQKRIQRMYISATFMIFSPNSIKYNTYLLIDLGPII